MTKFNQLIWAMCILVVLTSISSCKKKDKDNNDTSSDDPVTESVSFNINQAEELLPVTLLNSDDEYAELCSYHISEAINWSEFQMHLQLAENATRVNGESDNGNTYTWSSPHPYYDSLTVNYFWTYSEDDEQRQWDINLRLPDGDLVHYVTATELTDGSQGDLQFNYEWTCNYDRILYPEYYETCQEYNILYDWNKSTNGTLYYSSQCESIDPYYLYLYKYNIISYPNKSGILDYYFLGKKYYHIEWDSEGKGSWIRYSDGIEHSTGSW